MSIKCIAAITNGDGHFSIEDIEVSDPLEGEVLVQIKASGICHTDFDSLTWGKQLVMGHEGAGIVIKVGAGVHHVKAGDSVILNWAIPCGNCSQCLLGNEHLCENNSPVIAGNTGFSKGHAHLEGTTFHNSPISRSFNLGTLSQFTLVKSEAVLKYVSPISFAAASVLGCGVMTGYGSVMNAAKVEAGSSVVVLGAGGVGLNVIQAARIAKAAHIIAIDINESRFKMAKALGATETILADKADKNLLQAAEKVKEILGGSRADYAFECTARPELGASPLAMIRNGGTAVQVSGIEQEILIDMNLFEWDKKYINPLYGQCKPKTDFAKMIHHYEHGELLLEEIISRIYCLDDLQKAFDDMLSGRNAKGVILF
jgi:Zn-dependent alcohol dehydrogenase